MQDVVRENSSCRTPHSSTSSSEFAPWRELARDVGISARRRLDRIAVTLIVATSAIALAPQALALPSFAQQTGQPCQTCHVGGFGPQLTPFGRAFKLGGYTLKAPDTDSIPVAAMLVASETHTKKDQPEDAAPHFGRNDNFSIQEASLFLAGRITDHIGTFAQATYSDNGDKLGIDNVDVRYARTSKVDDKPLIFGMSVNNNPGLSDTWNTLTAWRFPYMASELVPEIGAAPLIDGALEHSVVGTSGYIFYDNHWYAELGGYASLSHSVLERLNVDDPGSVSGIAPYWRVAYSHDSKGHSWSIGAFGLDANLRPDRMPGPADKYRDTGVDASLQLFDMGPHVVTVNAAYTHEHQLRDATFASGSAQNRRGAVESAALNASYYYDNHYGVTVGRFTLHGSSDAGLFAPEPASGSRTGRPDSSGTIVQADWTPYGASGSWRAPWVNLRLGMQYTIYDKFNGAARNYDGFGRNARDNDTLFVFAWLVL